MPPKVAIDRLVAPVLSALLGLSAITAANPALTNPEPNALGYADHLGKLSAWWEVGGIQLSDDLTLPLRINFHSAQDKTGSSILGWNWWLPALESTVVKESEGHAVVRMIGGKRLHLWKSSSTPNTYFSPDKRWKGTDDGKGNFQLSNTSEKWILNFRKGRLGELTSPDGQLFSWNYLADGRPESIKTPDGHTLLKVDYSDKGIAEALLFTNGQGKQEKISLGIEPLLVPNIPVPLMALQDLVDAKGEHTTFKYSDALESTTEFSLQTITEGSTEPGTTLKWELASSLVKAVDETTYRIEQKGGKRPKISRLYPDKPHDSYWYDTSRGVAIIEEGKDSAERNYILVHGPNFGLQRKAVTKENGVVTDSIEYHYDTLGRLLAERSLKNTVRYVYGDLDSNFDQSTLPSTETIRRIGPDGKLLEELIGPRIRVSYANGTPEWHVVKNPE